MNPFISSQLQVLIEGLRMLETFVTAPLGLYSDIKMLRESLPLPEAADLTREELQERRTAYMSMTDAPLDLALDTMSSINACLDIVDRLKEGGRESSGLTPEWILRARRVLGRGEQRVAADIRAKLAATIRGLYVIVDPEATRGRPVLQVAEATLKGGASVLQLRDKAHDKGEILRVARQLKSICDRHGALLVVNDDADVALSAGAHGLHVGQSDLPVADARRLLRPQQIIGRSNNTIEEAMDSQALGVDYHAVGAVFETATMGKGARPAAGLELVSAIKGRVAQPVVAIGGINATNIADVVRAGADCACVVSAVTYADDPEAATRELVDAIENARAR